MCLRIQLYTAFAPYTELYTEHISVYGIASARVTAAPEISIQNMDIYIHGPASARVAAAIEIGIQNIDVYLWTCHRLSSRSPGD